MTRLARAFEAARLDHLNRTARAHRLLLDTLRADDSRAARRLFLLTADAKALRCELKADAYAAADLPAEAQYWSERATSYAFAAAIIRAKGAPLADVAHWSGLEDTVVLGMGNF